jgi:cellulose synthase/poly-beta-1,6-N-acetylglucosamine synthase-like glycosyltransferase
MASDPVLAGPADPAAVAAPEVTVVVPVLNEQATVEPLYDGIVTTLQAARIPAELIFVDDGSTDGTFAILERHTRPTRTCASSSSSATSASTRPCTPASPVPAAASW